MSNGRWVLRHTGAYVMGGYAGGGALTQATCTGSNNGQYAADYFGNGTVSPTHKLTSGTTGGIYHFYNCYCGGSSSCYPSCGSALPDSSGKVYECVWP